ncbi:unnamed protein product [Allacma fusca]|uniref:Uncharacterized protein n=1 Tax=Allacma fusca TaxID=39272 RepID=A0A8J2LQG8_9HEXA|nr:unnamed protein product [Allacma fusca]
MKDLPLRVTRVLVVVVVVFSSNVSSLLIPESGGGGGGGGSHRNLENVLTRLSSRLDVIALRIDHLDNRLGRFQASVNNRLDGIENSLTATKLRVDMMTEEVTRVDENLSRKWKNFEMKIDTSVTSLDNKYESKLNLVLREGRRIGDSLHGIFSSVEKRVTALVSSVNATLIQFMELSNTSLKALSSQSAAASLVPATGGVSTTAQPNSNLITNKVSNMFDDLIERSVRMENSIRESLSVSNATRREFQESFRSLMAFRARTTGSYHSPGGSNAAATAEATSMAILETLASTESMSTAISRRLNELTRSIEERFELVSMTLNGFFESCIRIQEGAPLIEEHIAELLDKILNSFENSTTCPDYKRLLDKLDTMDYKCDFPETTLTSPPPAPTLRPEDNKTSTNYEDIVRNSEHLAEEDKKLLWDSLFPLSNVNNASSSSYVPE